MLKIDCKTCKELVNQPLDNCLDNRYNHFIKNPELFYSIPSLREKKIFPQKASDMERFYKTIHEIFLNDKKEFEYEKPLDFEMGHNHFLCKKQILCECDFIENHEITNFYQINPMLFRSGTLTEYAFQKIDLHKINTIISFEIGSDEVIESLKGLNLVHLPFHPDTTQEKYPQMINRFFEELEKANGNVLFHCSHGVDRTGFFCGVYRMVKDNWTFGQAKEEMQKFKSINPTYFQKYLDYLKTFNPKPYQK